MSPIFIMLSCYCLIMHVPLDSFVHYPPVKSERLDNRICSTPESAGQLNLRKFGIHSFDKNLNKFRQSLSEYTKNTYSGLSSHCSLYEGVNLNFL